MLYEYLIMASMLAGSALVSTTIWARTKTRVRLMGLVLFIAMLPLLAGSGFMALGHPAPWLTRVTVPTGTHDVLSVKFVQDIAIYLWLGIEGEEAPRSFKLPWSDTEAQRLDRLATAKLRVGQRFMVTIGDGVSTGNRVYPDKPQPVMPEKTVPQSLPPIYERTP